MDIFLIILMTLGALSALIIFINTKDVLISCLPILVFCLIPAMTFMNNVNNNDNETDTCRTAQDSYCCCSGCCCGGTCSSDEEVQVESVDTSATSSHEYIEDEDEYTTSERVWVSVAVSVFIVFVFIVCLAAMVS